MSRRMALLTETTASPNSPSESRSLDDLRNGAMSKTDGDAMELTSEESEIVQEEENENAEDYPNGIALALIFVALLLSMFLVLCPIVTTRRLLRPVNQ
jgi:hypothetical protein